MAVDKEYLDKMAEAGCGVEGCTHDTHDKPFFLHARCHIKSGLEVSYLHGSGELVLACNTCKLPVGTVAVAE